MGAKRPRGIYRDFQGGTSAEQKCPRKFAIQGKRPETFPKMVSMFRCLKVSTGKFIEFSTARLQTHKQTFCHHRDSAGIATLKSVWGLTTCSIRMMGTSQGIGCFGDAGDPGGSLESDPEHRSCRAEDGVHGESSLSSPP